MNPKRQDPFVVSGTQKLLYNKVTQIFIDISPSQLPLPLWIQVFSVGGTYYYYIIIIGGTYYYSLGRIQL